MKLKHAIPYIIMIVAAVVILVAFQLWQVSVTDSVAPVIQFSDNILEVSVLDGEDAMLQGITAIDDQDGDVTNSIVVEKIGNINDNNEVLVSYAAFDRSGNVSKIQRTIRYFDYVSPHFSLTNPLLFIYGRDVNVEYNVLAHDVIDGDISHKIKPTIISEVPLSSEGIHQMLFRVTNSLGDSVEVKLPVEVYPAGKYDSTLTLKQYLVYIPRGSSFNAYDYLSIFRYGDTNITLERMIPSNVQVKVSGRVDTAVNGVYPVNYTVTYSDDVMSHVAISKLIVIVEG